jgi:hypothetical protein
MEIDRMEWIVVDGEDEELIVDKAQKNPADVG